MNRWIFLTVAAVPFMIATWNSDSGPSLVWWTTHALEKVRPYAPIPPGLFKDATIQAAANEFEPFQIVLRAEGSDIHGVDVSASDLKGPREVISQENITIYFQGFMNVTHPSSVDGERGEWPDPLLPRTDGYSGERRNAFPFSLRRGRNQPLWIEVYVPPQTPPGNYRGDILISMNGESAASVPVVVQVWNFGLPSTSSLPTSFGLNGLTALRKHYGRYTNDSDLRALTWEYQKAALRHRISIHGGTMVPPPFQKQRGDLRILWDEYDAEVGPFLDGTVFSGNDPLPGARATTIDLRTRQGLESDGERIAYWRAFVRHFREKGWIDRLFHYLWDEPEASEHTEVVTNGELAHRADPDLKNLLTSPYRPEWSGVVDVWAPLINCFEARQGENFCNPMASFSRYSAEKSKGKKLWWYQSCASHGCQTSVGEYFRGWPSYMIDTTPVANRIMQWMAWKYGIQGELYFNTTEAFAHKTDPWDSLLLFTGNGDGTLLYPGRPDRIGGRTHIPIESVRLKLIREGLEDYEYLTLMDRIGASHHASGLVKNIIRSTYDFDRDPAALYAARQAMGEEIHRRNRSPVP
jgi:hypothetical protein